MDAITYSAARANLADTMDKVCEDHEPVIITRNGQRAAVRGDALPGRNNAMEETAYLPRSPRNVKRLVDAIAELEAGRGHERKLAG